jgi:hypothetical protein
MPVADTVIHGEGDRVIVTERVKDTDTERVNGCVVGMPETEPVPVIERVKGRLVGIPVVESVLVGDILYVRETVIERVKGCVVGIPVIDIVIDVVAVGKNDAGTVSIGEREIVTVTELLYVNDVL